MRVRLIGGDNDGKTVDYAGPIISMAKCLPITPFSADIPKFVLTDETNETYRVEELRDGTGKWGFFGVPTHWNKDDLIDGACDAGIIKGKYLVVR